MRPALLLVDMQNDYLVNDRLQPAAGELVFRCAHALAAARAAGLPVVHVRTTVDGVGAHAMPHWRARGDVRCVAGTPGHESPAPLAARAGEAVVHKTHYSAFEDPSLGARLDELGVDTIVLAGLHAHACVRSTALAAYRSGREIVLLEDAIGSDDPMHDAATRRYLGDRSVHRWTTDAFSAAVASDRLPGAGGSIDHRAPHDGRRLFAVHDAGDSDIRSAVDAASAAARPWAHAPRDARVASLRALADRLEVDGDPLVRDIVQHVGKPIREATGEVARSVALLRAVAANVETTSSEPRVVETTSNSAAGGNAQVGSRWRRRPLGVVAMITPWNNPLAIPVGKLAGAIGHGNAVVWKPAVPGTRIAERVLAALRSCLEPDLVTLVTGGDAASLGLMRADGVDAVTISGSSRAGYAAQEVCATRRVPLQAELGGNNAALVWRDADLETACLAVIRGAFGFAGQRCTANRRVVVDAAAAPRVEKILRTHAEALPWGDPFDPDVVMGPVISRAKQTAIEALLARCEADGVRVERFGTCRAEMPVDGAYVRPAIVWDPDPSHEVVQHETFGPVLVVQTATDWAHAMSLVNGVSQGLVAALFSPSRERRAAFLEEAEAGILKLDQGTDGASVDLPFGGWKGSGVGPPEHGPGNEAFYTRHQSVYEE